MVDRRSDKRQPLSWVWLPVGAVIYAAIALVLLALNLEPIRGSGVRLPAWTLVTITLLIYVVLALASLGRLSVLRAVVGFIALAGLHAMIVASTSALVNFVAPGGYVRSIGTAVGDFPTLAFAQVVIVPVMLAPLRRVLVPHPRGGARSARPVSPSRVASSPRTPATPAAAGAAPARPATAPGIPRPLSPPPRAPAASPPAAAPAPAATDSPPREVARSEPPVAATETPTKDAAPTERPPADTPRVAAPAAAVPPERDRSADPAPAASPTEPPVRRPPREPLEDVVRISFARIVEQFPVDAFTLPPDRVAANLLEPNHVLVPQRLLTPQLADGVVHVKWDVIADQFARQALALSDADLAQRLPSEGLKLPLDEVIGQLPADVYRLSSPAADVRGLEDFPEPFQPEAPGPTLAQPQAHAVAAQQMDPHALAPSPPIAEPVEPHAVAPSPPPAPTAQQLDPHALPPSPPAPTAQQPELVSLMPTVEEPEPTEPEPAAVEEPARMVEPAPAPAPATTGATPEARVAALLGPSLGTLTVDTVAMDGTMLVVAAAPSLTRADVVETAVRVLPFLTDGRLPAPADQLTVRSHESAVVITPLGPDATLATVPASSTSLALLERLALRASVQMGSDGVRHRPAAAPGEADGMQAVSVPRHVEALAASLQAFGRVTPTVLRDAEGVLLYLFLPSHLDARRLGAFARDLARALTGAALGDMAAATVRFGSQCVVIRTAGGSVARTTLLVTGGGPTARPGLARLELERAALRLGTL